MIVSLAHRDMFSFLSNKKTLLMKENIPAVTRTHIDVDCCDGSAVFVLDNGHDHFAVSLETILSCLKVAEEAMYLKLARTGGVLSLTILRWDTRHEA